MSVCKYCNDEDDSNIVHSGTAALLLECLDDLYNICYACANKRREEKNAS